MGRGGEGPGAVVSVCMQGARVGKKHLCSDEHEVVGGGGEGEGEGEGEGAVVSACMHTCARMSTKTKSGRSSSAAISSELASACSTFPHSSVRKLSARSTRSALCSGVEHALISRNAFTVRR